MYRFRPCPGISRVGLTVEELLQHVGDHVAGADAVAADSFGSVVDSDRSGQSEHRSLRGVVCRETWFSPEAVDRGDVNNGVSADSPQQRQRVLGAQEDTADVDRHDMIPLGDRRLLESCLELDGSVVDEYIEASERTLDVVHHASDIVFATYVPG